jgi:hypothetical protein
MDYIYSSVYHIALAFIPHRVCTAVLFLRQYILAGATLCDDLTFQHRFVWFGGKGQTDG